MSNRKIKIKAVTLGFIIDITGSVFIGIIMGIVLVKLYPENSSSVDDFIQFYYSNIILMTITLVIGLCFTFLGSYIAAKLSNGEEIINAIAVGILGIVAGLFFIGSLPMWYNLLSFITIPPISFLGGYFAKKINIKNKTGSGQTGFVNGSSDH